MGDRESFFDDGRVKSLFDVEKVNAIISGIVDLAENLGANYLELSSATNSVHETCLVFMEDSAKGVSDAPGYGR